MENVLHGDVEANVIDPLVTGGDDELSLYMLIGWTPPPLGFFKLNMDGSALGNPRVFHVLEI
jgi:hypothetical protein